MFNIFDAVSDLFPIENDDNEGDLLDTEYVHSTSYGNDVECTYPTTENYDTSGDHKNSEKHTESIPVTEQNVQRDELNINYEFVRVFNEMQNRGLYMPKENPSSYVNKIFGIILDYFNLQLTHFLQVVYEDALRIYQNQKLNELSLRVHENTKNNSKWKILEPNSLGTSVRLDIGQRHLEKLLCHDTIFYIHKHIGMSVMYTLYFYFQNVDEEALKNTESQFIKSEINNCPLTDIYYMAVASIRILFNAVFHSKVIDEHNFVLIISRRPNYCYVFRERCGAFNLIAYPSNTKYKKTIRQLQQGGFVYPNPEDAVTVDAMKNYENLFLMLVQNNANPAFSSQ
jgi:hypothetical protein